MDIDVLGTQKLFGGTYHGCKDEAVHSAKGRKRETTSWQLNIVEQHHAMQYMQHAKSD